MTSRNLSLFSVSMTVVLGAAMAAQEPVRTPENKPKPAPQSAPDVVQPEAPKADSQEEQTPKTPSPAPQKADKPEPPRKGAIQSVDAAPADKADAAKGTTANLGTDVVAVRRNIESALQKDPTLKGTALTVTVTDDTVELTGVANNGRERTAARRIAQSYAGNLRVKDRISVAGAAPSTAPEPPASDKSKTQSADTDTDALAKPESDEQATPGKKANKPKKDPAKHGDQATEDPRDPRKKN